MTGDAPIDIVAFAPRHAEAFRSLNLAWIERSFFVEPPDRAQLDDPVATIIDPGGHVLVAESAGRVMGTAALLRHGDDAFELAKMCVADDARGRGLGRALLAAAIDLARARRAARLTLITHSSLVPAIALYRSAGFREIPYDPAGHDYVQCDIEMVLDLAEPR